MAYATPADVEARLGRALDDAETVIVNARLGDAELILKIAIPDLDDKVAASVTYEQTVVMVESDMVIRLLKNPDGFLQESDGNYSYMRSQELASGRLQVLPQEWDLLGVKASFAMLSPYLAPPGSEIAPLVPLSQESAIEQGFA